MKTALLVIVILILHSIAGSIINVTVLVNLKIGVCGNGLFQCISGGCIRDDYVCNGAVDCDDGSDERTIACGEGCPTIDDISIQPLYLNPNFEEIPRTGYVPPGTIGQLSCKVGYKEHSISSNVIHCKKDETWSEITFKCEPVCGEIEKRQSSSTGDIEDNIAQAPWHVAIYKMSKGRFEQFCGGTIISATAVLTAAHCFWDSLKQSVTSLDLFAAYAGKTERDYYVDDKTAQKLIIKDIQIFPRYRDIAGIYEGDIAVLVPDNPIIFQSYIKPVCLDFNTQRYIEPGTVGRVAGWGLDQNAKNTVLKIVDLPSVNCNNIELPRDNFNFFFTSDKFCVETTLTGNVCEGVGGSGFVVNNNKSGVTKYFLRGVASNGADGETKCAMNYYTTFTEIPLYERYIYKYV